VLEHARDEEIEEFTGAVYEINPPRVEAVELF